MGATASKDDGPLETLDAELREVNVQLSENQSKAGALKTQLEPDESAIDQINAQAKYLIGISKAAAREAEMSAQIAEAQECFGPPLCGQPPTFRCAAAERS